MPVLSKIFSRSAAQPLSRSAAQPLSRSAALASFAFALLLTACGSQDGTNTTTATANNANAATNSIVSTVPSVQTESGLLKSLAVLYPNGQLPANRGSQTAKELSENPAVLKQSAELQGSIQSQNSTNVQPQATPADERPVLRVQNTSLYGAYFFSIYVSEAMAAIGANPNWQLEGPAFWASLASGTGFSPVHRFRNLKNGSYLYTIYEAERVSIAVNYSATFTYEGIAWYARQTPATGWSPLYRFRNMTNGTYLFSAYESEKNEILANYSAIFQLEGIAYYVRLNPSVACTAAPTGATGYSQVFKGCDAYNNAIYYEKTECVRDNATGLIWQGHTPAGTGLRAIREFKTNLDSTTELQIWLGTQSGPNGATWIDIDFRVPTLAEINAPTNSIGFKNLINASNLCGASNWRMPTRDELWGIKKLNVSPNIDLDWFPNTGTYDYHSSTPNLTDQYHIGHPSTAYSVDFDVNYLDWGSAYRYNSSFKPTWYTAWFGTNYSHVRLVR